MIFAYELIMDWQRKQTETSDYYELRKYLDLYARYLTSNLSYFEFKIIFVDNYILFEIIVEITTIHRGRTILMR